MGESIENREHLAAYLLGELPAEEQLRLEQDYFVNDTAYEELVVVEDELAYDYIQERLPAERRARFESTIGATERGRQNLEFARSLLDALKASRPAAAAPARYWAMGIAAALALAVLPVWLAFHVAGLTAQLEKLRAEVVSAAAKIPPVPVPAPVEASFLLTPGLARSGDGPARLELAGQADTLRFELVLPPGAVAGDYVIAIRTAGGAEVWSRSATLSGRSVIALAPAKLLNSGDYEAVVRRLTAGEQAPDLATYSFHLIRK